MVSSFLSVVLIGGFAVASPEANQLQPAQTVLAQASEAKKSVWKSFLSQTGGFTILMPGDPLASKQTQNTQMGAIDTQMFVVERQQDSVAYMVAYSDLPPNLVQQVSKGEANVEQLFRGVRDGFVESIKGKILDERQITLAGYPGREIWLELPRDRKARNRIFLVNQRLYQVVVVVGKDKEKYLVKSVEGYLNSFKLLSR
ncbi:hypothetical protein BST81_16055 [Leptolyngbya sp. 'hensonii']|nr:hypothetical protein BST81_16055 [Leptolyngbya sp. 'hensonii']